MQPEHQKILDAISPPPAGASFSLVKVDTVAQPHPYCITPKHVAAASDHFGGMLGAAAIEYAEQHGARCDICRQQGRFLSYKEHTSDLTLFIGVPVKLQKSLDEVPGLHQYLMSIKEKAESLGITGFAFPLVHQTAGGVPA